MEPFILTMSYAYFRGSNGAVVEDEVHVFWIEAEVDSEDEETDEFDEEFDEIISNINLPEDADDFNLPENFQIECALKKLICEPAVTSEQKEANESVQGNMANIIKYCKKRVPYSQRYY